MVRKRRCSIPIPLLLVFLEVSCIGLALPVAHATTIVGIRTPAQVVIAADSMGTSRGYRIETTQTVCKIFTVKDTAFAIGGFVKDPIWNFDAENLTAESLRRQNRLTETANDLTERLTGMLGSYLERLKPGNPFLYAKLLEGEDGTITSILLTAYEGDQPVAIGMGFRASEEPGGRVRITATRVTCPGDCTNGVMYFFLGERRPIDRYIAEHGKDPLLPASSGAPFMVQLVIDGGSKRVGPPIDVVVIDRQGVSWPARKEGCGGAPVP
jgi:Proteasome subunit